MDDKKTRPRLKIGKTKDQDENIKIGKPRWEKTKKIKKIWKTKIRRNKPRSEKKNQKKPRSEKKIRKNQDWKN